MSAFERVKCGIPALDAVYDNIRLGDNVVWQLSRLEDFALIMRPFVEQAKLDGRNINYIRFASHAELLPEQPGVNRHELDPGIGFERFTVQVRSIITKEGRDAFYVFDSLSDLQVAWSSDLMMGNFFRVTCPYLFELDTVAYFPILRGRHSFAAVAKIRETTQLFTDVFSECVADGPSQQSGTENGALPSRLFIHPLKVWNRYSNTMFLAHSFKPSTGDVHPLTDAVEASRYYACVNAESASASEQNIDSWDRFFLDAKQAHARGELADATRTKMCNMMMTRDARMRTMVRRFFTARDYFEVRDRMVGTGLVGGKACGMLLARKVVAARLPELAPVMEPHDSFYVGTDVFYTYLVYNDLWGLRIRQQAGEGFVDAAAALAEGIRQGQFPSDIRQGFEHILDYYGQTPVIVRSSSFLEDGFGNAFAGKYESVFCANVGTPEERMAEFEDAVRTVYASTLDPSALEYRMRNGLDRSEEQMALLVQRVSGSLLANNCYMPTAAGVGYSHSAYRWLPDMDPDAGMLRLVMGLGTKAVDRTGRDYPRIVSLDRPQVTMMRTSAERHRFCQRYANLVDLDRRELVELPCTEVASLLSKDGSAAVMEHDTDAERMLRDRGQRKPVLFASCKGLAGNPAFTGALRSILRTLQREYDYPVDIEFTVNVGAGGEFVLNLLQCRPLQSLVGLAHEEVPDLPAGRTLFSVDGTAMGNARKATVDAVIFVDPEAYYRTPHAEKSQVATLVGAIGRRLVQEGCTGLLLAPGRIGTSSPELGVPVTFADIDGLMGVCEMAYSAAGYAPELSYGSHMFQDLVEADIYYAAIDERDGGLGVNVELLQRLPQDELATAGSAFANVVRVYRTRGTGLTLWHDAVSNRSVCGMRQEDAPFVSFE